MKAVIRSHNEGANFLSRACRDLGEQFDKPQLIEIKRYHPPRSLPQNAKLHAMIGELANEIGYSAAELKDWLKLEYGVYKTLDINGRKTNIPKSTAEYTKIEMAELIGHVERIGAEMGFRFSDDYETS